MLDVGIITELPKQLNDVKIGEIFSFGVQKCMRVTKKKCKDFQYICLHTARYFTLKYDAIGTTSVLTYYHELVYDNRTLNFDEDTIKDLKPRDTFINTTLDNEPYIKLDILQYSDNTDCVNLKTGRYVEFDASEDNDNINIIDMKINFN
jgi:hypothetical protein|tara:strand:- start:21708 stop:22154 length:447 start_codon:yes stop_codon:yes gene_type:complete